MRTVPPALRPAPAENENNGSAAKGHSGTRANTANTLSRVTLTLLDEYSVEQYKRGYNPYDRGVSSPAQRAEDIWRRKPKRD